MAKAKKSNAKGVAAAANKKMPKSEVLCPLLVLFVAVITGVIFLPDVMNSAKPWLQRTLRLHNDSERVQPSPSQEARAETIPTGTVQDAMPSPPEEVKRAPPAPPALGEDAHKECAAWAALGECAANPAFMLEQCKASCSGGQYALQDTWNSSECMAWAGSGECEVNAKFMQQSCKLSCSKVLAQRRAYDARCPKPPESSAALRPGVINETFSLIMSSADFAHLQPERISEDPPIILFHNFLSDHEADTFIAHGKGKYEESRGVGVDKDGKMTDVKTEIRTSSHTWCQQAACINDPIVQGVIKRVSEVTRTPEANGEFAQLVYYHACDDVAGEKCAFYRRHSDYIEGDAHRAQGVRIFVRVEGLNPTSPALAPLALAPLASPVDRLESSKHRGPR